MRFAESIRRLAVKHHILSEHFVASAIAKRWVDASWRLQLRDKLKKNALRAGTPQPDVAKLLGVL